MNDREQRRLDKFERQLVFMTENAALYPKDSPGDKIAKRYAVEIPAAKEFAAAQTVLDRLAALSRKLDAINRNKFRSDPAKMGAWLTASHLEREPGSKTVRTKLPTT